MVASPLHRHNQSIDLGFYDSDTTLRPDWNEAVLHNAGNVSVVVFVEEHSVRVVAVHLAKSWLKNHVSEVVRKCMDQSVGHQRRPTTPHVYRKAMLVVAFDSSWGLLRSHKWKFLVRQYLNCEFPNWWIGRGGAENWPPRSSDLNPLNYHVWGYMKAMVYAHKVNTTELLQRIISAARSINNAAVLRKVTSSLVTQKMHPSKWRTLRTICLSA